MPDNEIFDRAELILGPETMARLAATRVILFGVGGVGSWAAEALVRTGIGNITLVDPDVVVPSNVNRQMPATSATIGRLKVEAAAERLLQINPRLNVETRPVAYSAATAADFNLADFDFVIDAIDSVADKALLIVNATAAPRSTTLVSSMGAARKIDPSRVRVAEFWKVKGCPLAAALRNRFKRTGIYPSRKFKAVFSDEIIPSHSAPGTPNGSLMHITATWGLTLASLIIRQLLVESGE